MGNSKLIRHFKSRNQFITIIRILSTKAQRPGAKSFWETEHDRARCGPELLSF